MIPAGNSPINIPSVFTTYSDNETIALGEKLAALLKKGSVVALRGNLGAGKTVLVKGIARGLGVTGEITSPTYTIVCEYEGAIGDEPVTVYHIDAYRLAGNDDFAAIGGEELIFGDGISIIEWSERIPSFISGDAIRVDIEIKGDNERSIEIYRLKTP
jgi:tRNA threonylcarbamoyladenosine biosynthesis protein TsaE